MSVGDGGLRDEVAKVVIQYFVIKTFSVVEQGLRDFRSLLNKKSDPDSLKLKDLPEAAIIGVGYCGSNISLYIAEIIDKLNPKKNEEKVEEIIKENPWWSRYLPWNAQRPQDSNERGLTNIVINPVIMIADSHEDNYNRIKSLGLYQNSDNLHLLEQIREVQGLGAGHIPIVGQYMGRTALNIKIKEDDKDGTYLKNWKGERSYFIDSVGSKINDTRLFFYIFSTGGGTGSGLTPELGLAQQYAYLKNSKEFEEKATHKDERDQLICSIGFGILPVLQAPSIQQLINSGRLICRYLAQEWRYDKDFNDQLPLTPNTLHAFNGMAFVSNDAMLWDIEQKHSNDISNKGLPENEIIKRCNQYVAQQIFHLLAAQSLDAEYEVASSSDRLDDLHEIRKFDANDLNNSINGPMVVGYGIMPEDELDVYKLYFSSLKLPHFNDVHQDVIEGISVAPLKSESYKTLIDSAATLKSVEELDSSFSKQIPLFSKATELVTIVTYPQDSKLSSEDFKLINLLNKRVFPNTKAERFAILKNTNPNAKSVELTQYICGSACLTHELMSHFFTYISACFLKDRGSEDFAPNLNKELSEGALNIDAIRESFREFEDLAPVIGGRRSKGKWFEIKVNAENNFKRLIQDDQSFVPIEDVRVTVEDVIDALLYLQETYDFEPYSAIPIDPRITD